MRNLKLKYYNTSLVNVKNGKFLLFDPNSKGNEKQDYYVGNEMGLHVILSERQANGQPAVKLLTEVPGIVGAEYLALNCEICLATDSGEVFYVDPNTGATNEGIFCEDGILKMSWSPTQEVVAFVSKKHNLVVLTCTLDLIIEQSLNEQCSDDTQFVTVGWGKKETQFHGSEGKAASKVKPEFEVPANIDELAQDIEIRWRGDGMLFVVSFVSLERGRMFKVFDNEGQVKYVSEKVSNLEYAIDWRPSGNWIAVPHRLPNKSTIGLFEKNGLRHREIVLPFDLASQPIVSLKWNTDSEILALQTKTVNAENKCTQHCLYLYSIGNYHWYLKQKLEFKDKGAISTFLWDIRLGEEKTLHVLLENGALLTYNWHFDVDKCDEAGAVAVIDGSKLLITDFTKSVIPPPMCNYKIVMDSSVNASSFHYDNTENQMNLCVYDADSKFHIYKSNLDSKVLVEVKSVSSPPRLESDLYLNFGNMCYLGENLIVASMTMNAEKSKIVLVKLENDNYRIQSTLKVNGVVCVLCSSNSPSSKTANTIYIQTTDGRIHSILIQDDGTLSMGNFRLTLPIIANKIEYYNDGRNAGIVALCQNQRLYIDEHCAADDVTSFSLILNDNKHQYLTFTKLARLYFMDLSTKDFVTSERKIERGGKLVMVNTNETRVVLQMPRGNLEAIHPRTLSIAKMARLLDKKQYRQAMDMLRKQRINLNMICDYNMSEFVDNLNVFLEDIQDSNWLTLFISDLQNQDFTKTMYAAYCKSLPVSVYPSDFKVEEKVNHLSEKIYERMQKFSELETNSKSKYRLPIITALVKLNRLDEALQMIWQEKISEQSNLNKSVDVENNISSSDESMRHLLYLVDVNDLYNVALGTYDFNLVLFVAQKSQKDPKEYLPFLKELQKFELNYRKFKIDEYLKRYEKALENISAHCCDTTSESDGRFEEALNFIKRHSLYSLAQSSFKDHAKFLQEICLAYADQLRASGKLENASVMYERGGNLEQAMLSARHILDWERVLILTQQQHPEKVSEAALSMVSSLEEHGRYIEAFHLQKTYGNDYSAAIKSLLKGRLFLKAIYEVKLNSQSDEINEQNQLIEIISSDLESYASILESSINADHELYVNYKTRLLELRVKQATKNTAIESGFGINNEGIDESDLLSDTTSMRSSHYTGSSRGTGKTFRSSKNRRKHERKLFSLKPGNPFEDIALIDALYNHAIKVTQQQQQIHDICKAMLELHVDALARSIQKIYKELLKLIQDTLHEIWIPELIVSAGGMTQQQLLQNGGNIDYTQLLSEQRYALLDPMKRCKPQINLIDWEHEILR